MQAIKRATLGVFGVFFVGVLGCDPSGLDESLAGRQIPKFVSAKGLSRHYVEATFASEPNLAMATPSRFRITASNGQEVAIRDVFSLDAPNVLVFTTDSQGEEQYTLSIKDSDPAGADLGPQPGLGQASSDGTSVVFLGSPSGFEPGLMSAISLSNSTVLLTFSIRLDRPTAQNRLYYDISDPDLNVLGAVLAADDLSLTLTTTPQSDVEYDVKVTNVRGNIYTYGGYFIDPDFSTATFQGIAPNDSVRPRLVRADMLDYETVVLSFSEPLENHVDNVSNYSIAPSLTVLGVTLNEWKTQATLKVLPVTAGVVYTVTANSFIEDRAGNLMDPAFKTATFGIPANETVKPKLVSAVSTGSSTVLLSFSEPVSDNAGDPTNYSIDPILVITAADLSEFKTQVLLTTLPQTAGTEYTVTVAGIEDSVGNDIDPDFDSAMFTFEGANANDPEFAKLPPRVVGALATSDTTVVVSFNKPMGDSADEEANYYITGPETVFLFVTDAVRSPDGTQVRLTTSPQADYDYTVQAVGVKDENGNSIPPPDGIFTSPVGFDPSRAIFRGIAPDSIDKQIDTDGDEFADWFENAGWEILIGLANGGVKRAFVTSDPYNPDTDGDGFDDGDENAHNWDPRTDDTDADQLTDGEEFNLWYSDPADQDSDNDGIDDLTEVTFFKTSPILADTDGDGFSDDQELFELSRNPNLADLPRPNIKADNVFLQINEKYTYTDTEGRSISDTSSSQATLTQSTETKFARSDTAVVKVGAEVELEISKEPSLTIGANLGAEYTMQNSSESTRSAQQQYQTSITRARDITTAREVIREITGASVSATLTIVNEGDIAFSIGNLEISVLQQAGPNRSQFLPVATLVPSGGNNTFNLGPLVLDRGPFIFKNTDVFPNLVEDLMRAPRGLILKVANFDMTDEFGRNFAFTSQEVNDRTAEIRIDYGDGRTEAFRVATYGGLDDLGIAGPPGGYVGGFNEFGETAGISLDFALQSILKLTRNPSDPDAIVAGPNGIANTVAEDDDVQVVPPATSGLDDRQIVVSAGANGVLDTSPASGDDELAKTVGYDTIATCNESTTEKIIEPPNFGDGVATSKIPDPCIPPLCDDEQLIPFGTVGVPPGSIIVSPGDNGVLETAPNSTGEGDDQRKGPGDPCDEDSDCDDGACDAREVINRIGNSTNGDRNRFWIALTSERIPVGTDIGDVNLQPGFVILLAFIQDVDRDGLSGQEEYIHGSNDRNKDTDADGIGDFAEVRLGWLVEVENPYRAYPDPRLDDSDFDEKSDAEEMEAATDPRLVDTDIDGINDNFELDNESGNPLPGMSLPELCPVIMIPSRLNPLREDSDGDRLDDGREVELGTCPLDATDGPQFLDTDEDGLTNLQEAMPRTLSFINCSGANQMVFNVTSDGTNGDTDFDGLPDLLEAGSAALGIVGLGSNPRDVDSDNDGLLDFDEFANFALYQHLTLEFPGFFLVEGDSQRIGTKLNDCDSDDDGLTDAFEHQGGWTVLATGDANARSVTSSPLSADTDADGLDDGDEFTQRTDPTDPDTDGDGRRDGNEVASGTNPLSPDISVYVIYRRISFPDGPECSGSAAAGAEWEWSLRVRRPVDGNGEGQLVDLHTCTGGIPCRTIYDLDEFSSSFVLRPGETFSLAGMILDRDFCCGIQYTPEQIPCWGEACYYDFYPGCTDDCGCYRNAAVSCVGNFIKTIAFEDLVGGPDHVVGTLMLGPETFVNIEGGAENDKCKANIFYEIVIE